MSKSVFDASAILVLIQAEAGADKLTLEVRSQAVASSVNMAEVLGKLILKGWDPETAWGDALSCVSDIAEQTASQAKEAGTLVAKTAKYGLSLGDRSCLALAISLKAPVYTTEQIWKT